MPKIIVKTKESIGEMIYETSYEFEEYSDFISYEDWKQRQAAEMARGSDGQFDIVNEYMTKNYKH